MAAIGIRIKQRRKELGISQEELAKMLGYKSKSTINKIEAGINDIPQNKIMSFAHALNTTPAYLLNLDNEEHASESLSAFPASSNIPLLVEVLKDMSAEQIDRVIKYAEFLKASQTLS